MAKPDYADEIIAQSPSLQKMMASKKALADKLRVLYPSEGLGDFKTYANLIKNIPYNIDYVFNQLGLTCQEEFKNIIDENYALYKDNDVVYTANLYENSNIIYAPIREVASDASYCFKGSNLKYVEPLTITSGSNITEMFNADVNHLELTLTGTTPFSCKGPYVKSNVLKKLKVNGVLYCTANGAYEGNSCFYCPNLEYADITIDVSQVNRSYWLARYFIYSTKPVDGLKFNGLQKPPLCSGVTPRTYFLPYTTADIIIDYVTNHIIDLTDESNKTYLSYFNSNRTYQNQRSVNIFLLLSQNETALKDAGRYSEYEDLLNTKGWVSLEQYKEGNPLSIV